jgi:hypothetical protein
MTKSFINDLLLGPHPLNSPFWYLDREGSLDYGLARHAFLNELLLMVE